MENLLKHLIKPVASVVKIPKETARLLLYLVLSLGFFAVGGLLLGRMDMQVSTRLFLICLCGGLFLGGLHAWVLKRQRVPSLHGTVLTLGIGVLGAAVFALSMEAWRDPFAFTIPLGPGLGFFFPFFLQQAFLMHLEVPVYLPPMATIESLEGVRGMLALSGATVKFIRFRFVHSHMHADLPREMLLPLVQESQKLSCIELLAAGILDSNETTDHPEISIFGDEGSYQWAFKHHRKWLAPGVAIHGMPMWFRRQSVVDSQGVKKRLEVTTVKVLRSTADQTQTPAYVLY